MKTALTVLLIFITITGFSQKFHFQVQCNKITAGKSLLDSAVIKGEEYIFPERIHKTYLDTITGLLTVQLRGVNKNGNHLDNFGNIVQYDLRNKKLLWSKVMAYQISSLYQFSNTMIFTLENKSYILDIHSGKELWELKNNLYYVDPIRNIGVGYKTETSNKLEGINLKEGNIIWKRDLNREYGWNNVIHLNDSTLMIVAAGLHLLNKSTGIGWDYNTITGKKDYTQAAVKSAVGVAVGVLSDTYLISGGPNLVSELMSNTLMDSTSIYFASKEQLVRLNKQSGDILWKYSFPDDLASRSSILLNDTALLMVNKGMAIKGNKQIDFGKPFLGAFDKQTANNYSCQ